ncbi:GntR family transcriptional regulator [Streptomyces sp. 846.5]|nr:GntR family transcriptional regulator [Streptomyces sp. 846.5]TDT97469.1 GntR family transcriptional regulator [Streptomyces sp. 846.5]
MSQPALRVDTASPVPPYEQIRAQLAGLIRAGRLADGQRLAPVRQLAADLDLAVGTVARAYRELEATDLVRTRRGAGTRVRAPTPGPDTDDQLERLARDYIQAARLLGADDARLINALRDALGA